MPTSPRPGLTACSRSSIATWHNLDMNYRLALAGDPVEHSLSPAMHRAALDATGLSGSYRLLRCDEDGLRAVVAQLRAGDWDGLNVTMPHKSLAARLSDELTPLAKRSGSVNTLMMRQGHVWGHSTDAVAMAQALSNAPFAGNAPLLVLGSGGAAAAVLAASEREVFLAARDTETAKALASKHPHIEVEVVGFGTAVVGAIVVNATSLGMAGESLPGGILEVAGGLIDLPYGAEETPAAAAARGRGLPLLDGYRFLAMQAAESFAWWTGRAVGVGVLVEAARNA